MNEGQIWEAAMSSGAKKLDNLCAIIDNNGLQAQGRIADRLNSEPIADKWRAFGWNVIEIDGHNMEEILEALEGRISVRVVNIPSIKPMNRERIIELSKDVKGVVTAEEHSVIGGLGGAVAEALRLEKIAIEFVGVEDQFGSSAHTYDDILNYLGLTAEHIQEAVEEIYSL